MTGRERDPWVCAWCGQRNDHDGVICTACSRYGTTTYRASDPVDTLGDASLVSTALDLGLQAWRTTPSRDRFIEAVAALGRLREAATRLEAAEEALARISNRYCLHSKGDVRAESACLHKPSDQWCSVCIARAAEDAPMPERDPVDALVRRLRQWINEHCEDEMLGFTHAVEWPLADLGALAARLEAAERRLSVARVALERICSYTNTPASVGACVSIARDGLRALHAEDAADA